MTGIFGDLFDYNGDGKLDVVEQAADFLAFQEMMKDQNDDAFDSTEEDDEEF